MECKVKNECGRKELSECVQRKDWPVGMMEKIDEGRLSSAFMYVQTLILYFNYAPAQDSISPKTTASRHESFAATVRAIPATGCGNDIALTETKSRHASGLSRISNEFTPCGKVVVRHYATRTIRD